jgi:Arc/MetJ-type ribon-helix-helix transcriptional regulator
MRTTTVRLDADEERALDELAAVYGGRSSALREGLRLLAGSTRRQAALAELVHEWAKEAGPVDDNTISRVADRYGL